MTDVISVNSELNLAVLADDLSWQVDSEELMKFILLVDEHVADFDFTKTLAKKLSKIVKKEEKAEKKIQKEQSERNFW